MKIIIKGAGGRMGKALSAIIENSEKHTVAAYCSMEFATDAAQNIYNNIHEFEGEADCIIDFSNHLATADVIGYAVKKNLPIVVATTGQSEEELAIIKGAADSIPVFYSQNMSLGVALLSCLAKIAAKAFPDADIEIVEKHHNQKLDVPSGTALLLAHRIQEALTDTVLLVGRHENGKRTAKEIGIHSLRLGNEVGTHEIIIATGAETITLKHEAENRSLFANGALAAAKFLGGKAAGLYSMQDII